jgi:hypothetical protein
VRKVLHGIPLRHQNARCISQFRLSEPVFELEYSEDRVVFGKECALLHLDVVVATARIGDNLAWILVYAQKQPPKFIEAKLFRATNFEGVIHRCIKRSPANHHGFYSYSFGMLTIEQDRLREFLAV